ncbi:hypothetical protein L484_001371 [Morus notabilis]|uniref:Helicase MAGATAMA 3 n=2 Tax=Morus notabilis TaxID=981085 RepID=W9SDH3_9ROSA|nr:hypothetical protein L484_001371 [Morus notabilis]
MNKNKPKDHMLPLRKEKKSDGKHTEEEKLPISPLTFGEFVKKMFGYIKEWLYFFTVNLHTHLPASVISLEDVKNMFAAVDSLKSFQPLLHDVPNEDLKEAYSRGSCFTRFNVARVNSLFLLESLPSKFSVPYSPNRRLIKEFCLEKACLIFCTTSGSAKLNIVDMPPLELLVIDEAAQLKECESTIPLQLPGIRHAILVGDERQLPSMVKSQISEGVYFGRSLFERLAFLEHKKYLLNVQYRMHLSISLFPNREFYGNQILDGQNVKARSSNRRFLSGKLYNSYSFIDVSHGKEEFDDKRSRKNRVEVSVVSEIVASLHKEFTLTRKKVRVGVISPYKAQVHAIAEKIKEYTSHAQSDFFVSVRTVDGFQGGEEDVIIISTVRCNGIGSVSFLSSRQRGNVALTRARYCLWIVGSGSTLSNSGTFWKKLVADAKERGCFHSALEDKILACAITFALLELNQVSMLRNLDSLLFRESKWKVCFTDAFWGSMTRFKSNTFCKRVFALLEKLSSGWRQQHIGGNHVVHGGISSQFVEYYVVNTQSYLVWTVDILKENSHYIQVLKVWDILPQSDVPELSNRLDVLYGSYSVKKMSHCKYICYDG